MASISALIVRPFNYVFRSDLARAASRFTSKAGLINLSGHYDPAVRETAAKNFASQSLGKLCPNYDELKQLPSKFSTAIARHTESSVETVVTILAIKLLKLFPVFGPEEDVFGYVGPGRRTGGVGESVKNVYNYSWDVKATKKPLVKFEVKTIDEDYLRTVLGSHAGAKAVAISLLFEEEKGLQVERATKHWVGWRREWLESFPNFVCDYLPANAISGTTTSIPNLRNKVD
jgi:hypothetical protein